LFPVLYTSFIRLRDVLLNLFAGGCSEIRRSGYYSAFNFLTRLGR